MLTHMQAVLACDTERTQLLEEEQQILAKLNKVLTSQHDLVNS
jgi:hypothetical protein